MTAMDPDMPALTPDDEEEAPPSRRTDAEPASAKKPLALWFKIAIGAVVLIAAAIVARTVLKADGKPKAATTSAALKTDAKAEKKADAKPAPAAASGAAAETGLPAWYSKEVTPWAEAFTVTVNNHDALLNGANGSDGLVKEFEAVKAKNAALEGELATMKSRLDALEGRVPSPATDP